MRKLKSLSVRNWIAIIFVLFVFICSFFTLTLNFREVFGGFVRGYINTSEDSIIMDKISNGLSTFDKRMDSYFILHDCAIDTYGAVQKFMGKTLIDDVDPNYNVVKLNNGYLTFKANGNSDSNELKEYLIDINNVCKENNADFLYVKKLGKGTYDTNLLPKYFPYRFSDNFQTVKIDMINSGINVLDLNDVIAEEGIDKYSLFYKTDHHWTTEAGLWAAGIIAERINEDFDIDFDSSKFDQENYFIEEHRTSFLGSQGTRTGKTFSGMDSFKVIYPKYPTNINYEEVNKNVVLYGDFKYTIFNNREYEDGYHMYMPVGFDLAIIENNESNNGKFNYSTNYKEV